MEHGSCCEGLCTGPEIVVPPQRHMTYIILGVGKRGLLEEEEGEGEGDVAGV